MGWSTVLESDELGGKVGSSLHYLQIKSLDGLINPQTVRHNVETKLLASFPLSSAKPANVSYHIYFQASCKLSTKPANICLLSFGHIDAISLSIFENFNNIVFEIIMSKSNVAPQVGGMGLRTVLGKTSHILTQFHL